MNQILRCDWLPERARWSYLARSGLPALSRKKHFPESHITRIAEHKRAVFMFDHNSKISCHVYENNHEMNFGNVRVVEHEANYHERLFLEALFSVQDPQYGNDHIAIPEVYKSLACARALDVLYCARFSRHERAHISACAYKNLRDSPQTKLDSENKCSFSIKRAR